MLYIVLGLQLPSCKINLFLIVRDINIETKINTREVYLVTPKYAIPLNRIDRYIKCGY